MEGCPSSTAYCTSPGPHIPSAARLEQNTFVVMPVNALHERIAAIDGAQNIGDFDGCAKSIYDDLSFRTGRSALHISRLVCSA
jgi:hypothetical protein